MKSLLPWLKRDKEMGVTPREWLQNLWEHPLTNVNMLSEKFLSGSWPSIDIAESDTDVTVKAEIPGMNEKELDISYQDGVLTIKGERKEEQEERKKNTYYRESYYGHFSRSIPLGDNLEWERTQATYKQGLLNISIPKKEGFENKIKVDVQS